MRKALAAANAHILVLTAQQQEPQDGNTTVHEQLQEAASAVDPAAQTAASGPEAPCGQDTVALQELQQQFQVQRQQLEAAHQQVKELAQHLALKYDCVAFAERRAALLEQQVSLTLTRAGPAWMCTVRTWPRLSSSWTPLVADDGMVCRKVCNSVYVLLC